MKTRRRSSWSQIGGQPDFDRKSGRAAAIDAERRRSLGIYYTPRSAADILAAWAIRNHTDTALEPSFGGCVLLQAILDRLSSLGATAPAEQIRGFDIDSSAFSYLERMLGNRRRHPGFVLGDFLRAEVTKTLYTAIVANPPFVSYHRMSSQQRKAVYTWRTLHAPEFPKTASLWAYFLAHAMSFLAPNGRLAFLLPAAALTSDYPGPLLETMRQRFKRVVVFSISEQLFLGEGTEERTIILLAEGYQPSSLASCSLTVKQVMSASELSSLFLHKGDEVDFNPHEQSNTLTSVQEIVSALKKKNEVCELGEIAAVTIGEVVGDTQFFVRPFGEWKSLSIPPKDLVPIITRTRQLPGIRLTSRDLLTHDREIPYMLRPRSPISSATARYLATYPQKLRSLNRTFAKRDPWHNVTYETGSKAFVGSLCHLGPRIVLNHADISCANGLYKIAPAKDGMRWRPVISAIAISTVTQLSAEWSGRTFGAGALKLEPRDVRRLLIPATYESLSVKNAAELIKKVDELIRCGQAGAAVDLVDDKLLIDTELINRSELQELRRLLAQLRRRRLRKINQNQN